MDQNLYKNNLSPLELLVHKIQHVSFGKIFQTGLLGINNILCQRSYDNCLCANATTTFLIATLSKMSCN